MAHSSSLLIIALLFVGLASSSNAILIINNVFITRIAVFGNLYCTTTGNQGPSCPTCKGIGGATVTVRQNGQTTALARTYTNSTGYFSVAFAAPNSMTYDPSASSIPCVAEVKLPIINCGVLPSTGFVRSGLSLYAVVQGPPGTNNIAVFTASKFQVAAS